ncbi:MAG: hypothetical protein ACJAXS_002082 [Colwellia sp.]|jgi:hypothetical protein
MNWKTLPQLSLLRNMFMRVSKAKYVDFNFFSILSCLSVDIKQYQYFNDVYLVLIIWAFLSIFLLLIDGVING